MKKGNETSLVYILAARGGHWDRTEVHASRSEWLAEFRRPLLVMFWN